jgi:hypothetical protein
MPASGTVCKQAPGRRTFLGDHLCDARRRVRSWLRVAHQLLQGRLGAGGGLRRRQAAGGGRPPLRQTELLRVRHLHTNRSACLLSRLLNQGFCVHVEIYGIIIRMSAGGLSGGQPMLLRGIPRHQRTYY